MNVRNILFACLVCAYAHVAFSMEADCRDDYDVQKQPHAAYLQSSNKTVSSRTGWPSKDKQTTLMLLGYFEALLGNKVSTEETLRQKYPKVFDVIDAGSN